jgi:hypothetical protein
MIDYACMQRNRKSQKSALTRAIKSGDPEKIRLACQKAVRQWESCGFWPDDWHRWQIALSDSRPWNAPHLDLSDLA